MATTPVWSSVSAVGVAVGTVNMAVSKPTGVATGGLYVAFCWSNLSTSAYTAPSGEGWLGPLSTASTGCAVYYRQTTGSEPSTETFVRNNSTGNGGVILSYFTAGTFDTTTPIASCATSTSAATTSIVLTQVTPTTNSSLLYEVVSSTALTAVTWTPPGTTTSLAASTSSGTAIPYALGDEVVNSGATGTRTWNHTVTVACRGAMMAINPAGGVPAGTTRNIRVSGSATTPTTQVRSSGSAVTVTRKIRSGGVAV